MDRQVMKRNRSGSRIVQKWIGTVLLLSVAMIFGCTTCSHCPDTAGVDYSPVPGDDWDTSTPSEQDLDSDLVATMYCEAAELDTIFSLLVIKNGYLVAEAYFNDGAPDRKDRLQSVTKSFTSALVGIALEDGYIDSVNQKMLDFFPEIADEVTDPRKEEITIRQMLQMRTGYPWEESDAAYWEGLLSGYYIPLIEAFPLVTDPGTDFHYSNLTSNWLGIIIDRQAGMNLKSFAEEHIFAPLDIEAGEWGQDAEGHNNGCGDLHLTARDLAKFGQLYLDDGVFEGEQIVPVRWVHDSLMVYSVDAWKYRVGRNFKDIGYGYQWWSVRAGDNQYNLAWGHGGQQIAVLREHQMVIVVTAYPFWLEHDDTAWRHEKANLNLVADFISELPSR
jgi:CubicO group peptidase (beta-lactamase class C family)